MSNKKNTKNSNSSGSKKYNHTSKPEVNSSNEKKSIKIQTSDVYSSDNLNRINTDSIRHTHVTPAKKEVSSSEAVDKMLSLGKSFFVNGTIFVAITTVFVGGTIFFTGYDPIPIIEKHFIYTSNDDGAEVDEIVKLTSLDLSKDLPSEDVFDTFYNMVNVDLGEVLLNQDLFYEGREAFNSQMGKFYSPEYLEQLSTNDILYNVLESIYEGENRYPYSTTLTSIGKVIRNSKPLTKLSIDINAVDDDLGFHVWNIALFLNSNNQITDVKVLAENKTLKNTRTPLSPSLAVITNGVKDSTARSVNTFLKDISNEGLYNKFIASSKSFNQSQLKAFFSKMNMQEKDYEVLSEMFKVSKGNGSNFAITEVISTDFDGEPITDIILSLKSGEETYRYDLQYNRRDKSIVKISKL